MFAWLTGVTAGVHIRDARLLAVAGAAWLICIVWLALSAQRHRRNLRVVPIRIHVAGTRGKSTVTRMIAAGLRANGMRVLAKSTGSAPRLLLPDGTEEDWRRSGPASIREQQRFFARAAALGVDAVVLECMAIQPEMIWASETHMVRATTLVVTNARPDHFEELGENPQAMADALSCALAPGGKLFTGDDPATTPLLDKAARLECRITVVPMGHGDPHSENIALALSVCLAHCVPDEVARNGIDQASPDPGAFSQTDLTLNSRKVRFANAFACNDVESLAMRWNSIGSAERAVVLFNARADRPVRTWRFMRYLAGLPIRPQLFIAGDPLALRLARRAGFAARETHRMTSEDPALVLRDLASAATDGGIIWGLGNYQGIGAALAKHAHRQARAC